MVKSPGLFPPMITEEMWSVAVPELVTVTVTGPLVVPCVVVGKEMLPGTRVTAGGVKITEIAHDLLGWRMLGAWQVSDSLKSLALAPVIEIRLRLRAWSPVLVRITVCAGLGEPTVTLPRESEVGVRVATGPTRFCCPGGILKTKLPSTPGAEIEVPVTGMK